MDTFAAIDFETADHGPDSACAVGLVKVREGKIIQRMYYLIRPPRKSFLFTYIHGIEWADVSGKPTFEQIWPKLQESLADAEFIAAHNAPFDRRVLNACCEAADLSIPKHPFICTVQLARQVWGIFPTKLPDVCRSLSIDLEHHNALSDAEACARIVLAAQKEKRGHPTVPVNRG